jgi:hypothetical protein
MDACFDLGAMYGRGNGVAKDEARCAALYKQACDGGKALGCYNLGSMYANGKGVPTDLARTSALYQQACNGGEMLGCNNLGVMYARGEGVAQDWVRAGALFKQACDGGEMLGCKSLGQMYAAGTGVVKDESRAAALCKQAAAGRPAPSVAPAGRPDRPDPLDPSSCPRGQVLFDGHGRSVVCTGGAPTNTSDDPSLQALFRRYECADGRPMMKEFEINYDPCSSSSYLVICRVPAREPGAESKLLKGGCRRASANTSPIDYCCPSLP